jgi:hypothetical protein
MEPTVNNQSGQYIDPYQQGQLDNWKNRFKKISIAVWPYIMRGMNEFLLVMFNVIRGSIRIIKEQLFRS